MPKTLYLIDGSSFLYRFFFAIKGLSSNNHPTGAIFGFARMLLEIDKDSPEYISVIFDTKAKTFREGLFEHYKQNRPKMPDDLSVQIDPIKKLIEHFGISIIEKDGFEADDIIATYAEHFKDQFKIVIIANDKDLFQLIEDERVVMYDPIKKIFLNEKDVYIKTGVSPDQIADYLALIGDNIDNIPGIKSIGPKTACGLLKEYNSCENILKNIDNLKPKLKEVIEKNGNLLLYKKLTMLDKNVDINLSLEILKRGEKQQDKIVEFFLKFGFRSLLKNLKNDKQQSKTYVKAELPIIYAVDSKPLLFINDKIEELHDTVINYDVIVYDLKGLLRYGLNFLKVPFDIKLACYLLNSESAGDISKCFERLDDRMFYDINQTESLKYRLALAYNRLKELIRKQGMESLLFDIESYLSFVLFKMEKRGIKVDIEYLVKFKNELENRRRIIEEKIYTFAEEEFNINSTKELQRVLFDKLGIKPIKKTKTGFSTDSDTLTALSRDYEIANLILRYREISKVVSTYIKPFLEKADEQDRLHTTFNQTLTSTGRLSSSNPNLQNLPASEDDIHSGIRRSVIADKGCKLICSDYSQIELRVLAHLSKDKTLIDIFKNGEDVHTQTAVKLFGVHKTMVEKNLRRMAKTINFGILYGMGYQSLAKTLNISKNKAKEIIEKYFERFNMVKSFIDNTINFAKNYGYVETYFKRRRYFYNINSSNKRLAEFEKRAAVNAVIQGTAADIIKIAMVELDKRLDGLDAHMVLQVHDELLIEANDSIAGTIKEITKETMENVVRFDIPLLVNINLAENWLEAK